MATRTSLHGKLRSSGVSEVYSKGSLANIVFLPGRLLAILRDREDHFPFELAICAIFKNEARYLREWLTFHEGVGVQHFYLYNDNSTDDFEIVIAPWVERGMITLKNWPSKSQVAAYNDCIKRHRMDTRWLAFIDIDEFLFSPTGKILPEVMQDYSDMSGVFVYWILFGSSGHVSPPEEPVIESYSSCLGRTRAMVDEFDHGKSKDRSNYVTGWARDGKSVVNPRRVRFHKVHQPKRLWYGALVDERFRTPRQRRSDCDMPCDVLRINHYWSKSIAELKIKVDRGSIANRGRPSRNLERWLAREHMLNHATDLTILPIWNRIKSQTDQ